LPRASGVGAFGVFTERFALCASARTRKAAARLTPLVARFAAQHLIRDAPTRRAVILAPVAALRAAPSFYADEF